MQPEFTETLIGIAELAIALAGFSGVVVAFGSRSNGGWRPGDKLRLIFLLESSLTAAGFAIAILIILYLFPQSPDIAWKAGSSLWAIFMLGSLLSSRRRLRDNEQNPEDTDRLTNLAVTVVFFLLIVVQVANTVLWQEFGPFLAAICFNLAGATLQFARLIRSAFHE